VAARSLDRYADNLTGLPPKPPAALPIRRGGPVPDVTAAAKQAVHLVTAARHRTRPGLRATVRHYLRLENRT
ncbi:hypothetical protein ACFQ0D_36220, partial [Micromonospora zhanjiangensis]